MIDPSETEYRQPIAVRDGQLAPVTCAACGCRLASADDGFYHFSPSGGRDARGCRVDCADAAHDTSGTTLALLA
jgi:hypothetical protein